MEDMSVGMRELKSKLSEYMRRVKSGETLIVTEHGKPIGHIIPIKPTLEERMQSLIEAGIVTWNRSKFKPNKPVAINQSDRQVSELAEEGRNVDYLS